MEEIKFLLESHDAGMTCGLSDKRILKRLSTLMSVDVEKSVRKI